jgi:Outer membrane protein beta-barrel domain
MKNLKISTLVMVIICTLFVNNLFAQKGAYINIYTGYGMSMSSQNLNYYEFYNHTGSYDSDLIEQINISLGKGLNFGGSFGYMFNKNIGTELGISYLLGGKSKAKQQQDYLLSTTDHSISSNMLRFMPTMIISSGLENVNPYMRFGLVIGIGSVNYQYEENYDSDITKMKMKMYGGLALGLNAAVGANFNLNDKVSLFCEIIMVNMSYAPTKGEVTEALYNEIDQLINASTSEKEIEYVKSYDYDDFESSLEPRKELKQKLPFGSVGINFGIAISL